MKLDELNKKELLFVCKKLLKMRKRKVARGGGGY